METEQVKMAREFMVEAFLGQYFWEPGIQIFVKKNREKIKKLLIFELGFSGNINGVKAKFFSILCEAGVKLDAIASFHIITWDYCQELKFRKNEGAPELRSVFENEADKEALAFMK